MVAPLGTPPRGGLRAPNGRSAHSLRWHAVVPLVGAFAAMILICGIAMDLAISSRNAFDRVSHERAVDEASDRVQDSLLIAEASQRGFLVTARGPYLEPYHAATNAVGPALKELTALVSADPHRLAIVQAIHDSLIQKIAEMARTITLAQDGKAEEALQLVNSDVGMKLSVRIIAALHELQRDVRDRRSEASAHERIAVGRLVIALCLATAFSVAAASLALRELAAYTRKLRRREGERDALVQTLEARVAARTYDLGEATRRFELATNAAGVTVSVQDLDLRYVWINQAFHDFTPDAIVGKTDQHLGPPNAAALLERKKRGVLETGEPARLELHLTGPERDTWYDISLIPNYDSGGAIAGVIAAAVDVTQRKQTEAHVRLLMREIAHRAKNLLAVVLAMTRQTAASATSTADFMARFSARLESLSSSYDLLIRDDWQGATIEDLVWSQLSHHIDHGRSQITAHGPILRMPPDATQNLGMALHELATNAAKYGALSVPTGRVEITWSVVPREDGGRDCAIRWQESGGPPVTPPARRGFGQVVIERSVARVLGGVVALSYEPAGLDWSLTFPLTEAQGFSVIPE
jgi:two-component sensor histidine kinase/CHASE3 domain sensor protein